MNNKQAYILLVLIILFGLFLRLTFLRYNSIFSEPDDYYYLSILENSHGFSLPTISPYDGLSPQEFLGLYLPSVALHFFTSAYNAILITPLLFYIATAILIFFFAKELIDNNRFALLTTLLFILVLPFISKTLPSSYRGDSFVSVFLLLSFITLLKSLRASSPAWLAWAILSALSVIAGTLIWSGGIFIAPICLGALALILLYKFATPIGSKTLELILPHEFAEFKPIEESSKRIVALLIIMLFALIPYLLYVYTSSQSTGFISTKAISTFNNQTQGLIGSQISELQKPTNLDMIGAYNIFLVSPALALLAYSPAGNFGIIVWTFMAVVCSGFLYYFYSKVKKAKKLPFIMLALWFVVVGYFNTQYVRYSGLASIPIAILFSITIYIIIDNELVRKLRLDYMILAFVILVAIIFSLIYVAQLSPAGDINQQFLASLAWLKNNSANNSRVYVLWNEGSVVQAVANRYSYTGSLAGWDNVNVTNWFYGNGSEPSLPNVSEPLYIISRFNQINQSVGYCDFGNSTYLNCSKLYYNATVINTSYFKAKQPVLLSLLDNCSMLGCELSIGSSTLELVYNNPDSLIYKVIKEG